MPFISLENLQRFLNKLKGEFIATVNGTPPDQYGNVDVTDGGMTQEIKNTILACFRKVAWADENGLTAYVALQSALFHAPVTSISAVFTQGTAKITPDNTLDDLIPYLTVTANYQDGTSGEVIGYTLSGSLTVGTSTITVSYAGFITTFTVTVTSNAPIWHIGEGFYINGTLFAIAGNQSNARAIFVKETGTLPLTRQTGSSPYTYPDSEYYLIPIPSGTSGVKFMTSDSNVYGVIYGLKYDTSSASKWTVLDRVGWVNSTTTFTFPAGAGYWSFALKHGSAGTSNVTTSDTEKITYEYV